LKDGIVDKIEDNFGYGQKLKNFITKILQILLKKNFIFGKKNGRMLKMRKGPKIQLKI
jgi:hypothetical protein